MGQEGQLKSWRATATSNVSGNISLTSDWQVDGTLERFAVKSNTWGNGSLYLFTSGGNFVPEQLLAVTSVSGTQARAFYPRAVASCIAGSPFSSADGVKLAVQDYLVITGSGLGESKTGTVELFYK